MFNSALSVATELVQKILAFPMQSDPNRTKCLLLNICALKLNIRS